MLQAIYSVFVFLAIGYAAKQLRLVGNRQSGILLGFLLNFAIPAQIFSGTYHAQISLDFFWICLYGLMCNFIAACFAWMIATYFKVDRNNKITICLLCALGNTLLLGYPLVEGALGKEAANQVVLFDQFVTGIPFAFIAPIVLSLGGKTRFSLLLVFRQLSRSPLFLALLSGFAIRLLPFSVPESLFAPINSLAKTAIPVALFSVGVQLSLRTILDWKLPALLLSIKMFVAPILMFSVILSLGSLEKNDISWRMALLEVAMPPQISAIALVLRAGFDSKLALNAVAFGILISFITIPLWLWLSYL